MFKKNVTIAEECTMESDVADQLLAAVKKEVKQIMEEAVTKKFLHEDSASVTTLCGSVDACLRYRLRKRSSLSLFTNTDSVSALLHKVAKSLDCAKATSKTVSESKSDSLLGLSFKTISLDSTKTAAHRRQSVNGQHIKHLWLRLALFNKILVNMITYLVDNSSHFYEAGSLMADQSRGHLLAQLLEGPCALEFTKMKTADHLYTDPHADELVLRHRIHSGTKMHTQGSLPPSKRPTISFLNGRRNTSSSSEDSVRSAPLHAREYVESLHQNNRTTLLYGKNNVMVQPTHEDDLIPGYLSLHQSADQLTLKWTPNQLISSSRENGTIDENVEEVEKGLFLALNSNTHNGLADNVVRDSYVQNCQRFFHPKPHLYWDCAITLQMDEVVYLHCHNQVTCGGSLILIGFDGVQRPPFHFPHGGHLLAFLTCLETGLQPHYKLDPPLWAHKETGKIFPKLKRRCSSKQSLDASQPVIQDRDNIDYVFRIIHAFKPASSVHDLVDPKSLSVLQHDLFSHLKLPSIDLPWHSKKSISIQSQESIESVKEAEFSPVTEKPPLKTRDSLQKLCDTMRHQIISRAFSGWLTRCRHSRTVREHLSGLVYSGEPLSPVPPENEKSLTTELWNSMTDSEKLSKQYEIYRRIYYGGISKDIRDQVWPYLLGHYKFGWSERERALADSQAKTFFNQTMAEWMKVEQILAQRGKDNQRKESFQSAGYPSIHSVDYKRQLTRGDSNISNEVFLDTNGADLAGLEQMSVESSGNRKRAPMLVKCHSIDYHQVREDYCSVKTNFNSFDTSKIKKNDLLNSSTESEYTDQLLDELELNLHRIDKDVHRCDRTHWYFTEINLKKLRNIMCTYVWQNLDIGYIQGMCDLVAPLLVVFDDESLTYSCFNELMIRMVDNFPLGRAMDCHFGNMRSLIRVLDSELFDLIHRNGDYTHFFFCYRWLLLDFKREMLYDDVFLIWESIWAAKYVCSDSYVVFIALAMIEEYREIILDNNMDFIDIMKFFNEMAEKHNARHILHIARELVYRLQGLVENK